MHFLADLLNRCQNVSISAAPADITAHQFFHIIISGTTRLIQQGYRRHDLTGSAITALVSVLFNKCCLHWVKLPWLPDPFDRCDHIVLVHRCKGQARINPAPVDMHRAGAALAMIASLLRARQM
jgi:hypothetical protein